MTIGGGSNPLIKENEFYHNILPIDITNAGGQITNNNIYYNYTTPFQISGESIVKGHYPQFRKNYIYLHDNKQYMLSITSPVSRLVIMDNVIYGKKEDLLYIYIYILLNLFMFIVMEI